MREKYLYLHSLYLFHSLHVKKVSHTSTVPVEYDPPLADPHVPLHHSPHGAAHYLAIKLVTTHNIITCYSVALK